MYKVISVFPLAIALCMLLTACINREVDKEIDNGLISNNVYSNDFFNMTITIPDNWVVQSEAEKEALQKHGTEMLSGDNKKLKKAIKKSNKSSLNLFSLFKYKLGHTESYNSSITSVVEKVSILMGIRIGSDYHAHMKKLIAKGSLKYEFPDDPYTRDISGVSFDVLPMQLIVNGHEVKQETYSTKIDDYVLNFILVYIADDDKDELYDILNTLTFDKAKH